MHLYILIVDKNLKDHQNMEKAYMKYSQLLFVNIWFHFTILFAYSSET